MKIIGKTGEYLEVSYSERRRHLVGTGQYGRQGRNSRVELVKI